MKRPHALTALLCASIALFGMLAPVLASDDAAYVPNPSGFEIRRGTNLSHWLSQDFKWQPREQWITQNDINYIAACGFDHVRFPVDEKELWNEDGSKNEAAFALLEEGISWIREAGLRVILDMHVLRSHHFNADNEGGHNTLFTDPREQQHLVNLWKDLSEVVGDIPNSELAYEIMNEPVADNPEDWNNLVAQTIKGIRAWEPERVIVIGSNRWQMPSTFPLLKVPEGDKNIILSFHTYSPMLFTHFKAKWTGFKEFDGQVNYPGVIISQEDAEPWIAKWEDPNKMFVEQALEEWGPERLRQEIVPAVEKARELGLQLFCGEFGCLPTVPNDARMQYYRDIVSVFESEGIAWCNWEYKGDFGLFEWFGPGQTTGAPIPELLDALMQGQE